MQIRLLSTDTVEKWDNYVQSSQEGTLYHLTAWKGLIENTFGHKTYYTYTQEDGEITGILPLVFLKSPFFGKFIVSMPYLNYGGICANGERERKALLESAIEIAREENASHIELRHTINYDLGLQAKQSKAVMLLKLPASAEDLWSSFKTDLRTKIRRPEKDGVIAKSGCIELLDSFYEVFAANMRDLGTPVYSKDFFKIILETFPQRTKLCVLFLKNAPVAAGFLSGFKDKLEVPWASSVREYNRLKTSMMLYWHLLQFACKEGYKVFDFGRSTIGGGTYKFKEQWGAKPVQLYWHYWLANGNTLPELNPDNPKYRLAIKTWQKLPLWLTKAIGPSIVKYLP